MSRVKTRRASQSDTELPSLHFPHYLAEQCRAGSKSFLQGMLGQLRMFVVAAAFLSRKGCMYTLQSIIGWCRYKAHAAAEQQCVRCPPRQTWSCMRHAARRMSTLQHWHSGMMQPVPSPMQQVQQHDAAVPLASRTCSADKLSHTRPFFEPATMQPQAQHPLWRPLHKVL